MQSVMFCMDKMKHPMAALTQFRTPKAKEREREKTHTHKLEFPIWPVLENQSKDQTKTKTKNRPDQT